MNPERAQVSTSEPAQTKRKIRVKASQISPLVREMIVDQFIQRASSEAIADEMGIPVRTVTDVLLARILRKGPQPERGALSGLRRIA